MALPPAGAFMAFWAEMPNETAKRAAITIDFLIFED
jgi:hypothetical protein